ncbi:hypothetical protein T02_3800 [Trichinella nativa]|uniref:Uncharacterized protein n=1 Tax=Trichinella nativa TaxID=6335 RepID=A0A0V1KPM0_9BILA|nr:hypothetical protein T02_3800 [Trichinella nativa]
MKKRRSENGDDTKQNKRRQRSWDSNSVGLVSKGRSYPIEVLRLTIAPNSVRLASGKFKRVKLFLSFIRTNMHG